MDTREPTRRRAAGLAPRVTATGLLWALGAACVSGVSIFVNGWAVRQVAASPTVYTTAKNLVAALLLGLILVGRNRLRAGGRPSAGSSSAVPRRGWRTWGGLAAVAVIGGSVPFVLFFEGLAQAQSADAAFIQKSLVIWVVLLAVPLLGERVGRIQAGAMALLVGGVVLLNGGLAGLVGGAGGGLILAATWLWAVEVIVLRRLLATLDPLTVGLARMGLGGVLLVAWLAVSGSLAGLVGLGGAGWGLAALTGVALAAYVATWLAALARAQAVDVTAVLVFGAVVTALLSAGVQGVPLAPQLAGIAVVSAAALVLVTTGTRRVRGDRAAAAAG